MTDRRQRKDRRAGSRRASDAALLKCKNGTDHLVFAIVLVVVLGLTDLLLHFHPAAKALEIVIAATGHRLLFGGK